ncbi:MAG: acyl carrier protein [Bacillota bacterium]
MGERLEILLRLQNIFREIFDDDSIDINEESSRKEMADWDSVAHVKLVLTIEAEFNIHFTTDEVTSIQTVGDFIKTIEKREVS